MGRLILIAVVVFVVIWLLRRALAGPPAAGTPPAEAGEPHVDTQGDLVSCAHCGVNLPKSDARSAGGRYYCSEEHWRRGPPAG